MIPQHPVDSSEVVRDFYLNLHHQLGPEFIVRQYLDSAFNLENTLLWIQYKSQSLFIYINELSEYELGIDKTKNENPKILQRNIRRNPQLKKIINYKQCLLPVELQRFHSQLSPFIIIHSQVSDKKLNIYLKSQGISLLGKELLISDNLKNVIIKFIGNTNSSTTQQYIKKTFGPENLIVHNDNNYSVDSEQEIAIKTDINLELTERRFQNYNLCGVNGGKGSGKSEVILLRAKLLSKLFPEKKILILSSDEISSKNLIKRFSSLLPSSSSNKNILLFSFNKWCHFQLSPDQDVIDDDKINDIIINLVRKYSGENAISQQIFFREMNYIQGSVIKNESAYLKTRKNTQLSKEQHSVIWEIQLELSKILKEKNHLLHSDLPRLLWDVNNLGKAIDKYDHILVDDAHYFSPLAFNLIKKGLSPETGQLFISQDPRQGIINPINLWKDTGLDLRGKSARLLNCYQTNPYVLNAANAVYMHRLPDDTDKVIQFNFISDKNLKKPQLLHFNASRDEENRLLTEIKTLIQKDIMLQDIQLIACNRRTCSHLQELIQQTLGISTTFGNDSNQEQSLKICTLEQSQGTSAPYVFIFGLEELFESDNNFAEQIDNIDTSNYQQTLYIENTRKLNLAMTTATKELTLFLSADEIPKELITPHIHTPTKENNNPRAEVHRLGA